MGGSTWTTPEERAYLKLNVKQYEAAQEAKRTHLWFPTFYVCFLDKFTDYSNGRNETPLELLKKVRASPYTCNCVDTHSHSNAATEGMV